MPRVSLRLNEISLASLYINPHITQGTFRKGNAENKNLLFVLFFYMLNKSAINQGFPSASKLRFTESEHVPWLASPAVLPYCIMSQ